MVKTFARSSPEGSSSAAEVQLTPRSLLQETPRPFCTGYGRQHACRGIERTGHPPRALHQPKLLNARQGIAGRLDSGVNGIIGVQVLLKKRKLDQPKKKCPHSLMTLPLFWMTGWGSVLRSPAGKLARMCLAISGETPRRPRPRAQRCRVRKTPSR